MRDDILILWKTATIETIASYRKMIDSAIVQLSDEELFQRPSADCNSVGIILRHIAGNLLSRWTDYLTTDGEKPNRERDKEFEDWTGSRGELLSYFESGWHALLAAVEGVSHDTISTRILIRGEPHTIPQAIQRSLTHTTYHIGQITMLSRMVHQGEWKWLTIKPGGSLEHNRLTWGSSASRAVMGNVDKK